MGQPPAVVIIARHGARLDAADKQWHLTSPTPYDPPLTYGGWTQCRALGARIASLLQAREELYEAVESEYQAAQNGHGNSEQHDGDTHHTDHKAHPKRHKKHKIIIHSSPFLRCVQTSVAISAGISQYRGQQGKLSTETEATKKPSSTRGPPPKATGLTDSPNLAPIADEESTLHPKQKKTPPTQHHVKPRLRVDAFLGEWLSPDYYENITSPPSSVMMVAGAKADLLRRGDYVGSTEDAPDAPIAKGNFPGGWGSNTAGVGDSTIDTEKLADDVSTVSLKSPQRDRASTVNSNSSSGHGSIDVHTLRSSPVSSGYKPPVPRYAISPSDPIPAGYVSHARDACVEVDYQWDSMRAPQDWGDGGEYGEEWSSMHKRFRKGLQNMIAWYRLHPDTANQVHGHKRVLHPHPHDEDDSDTDTVLVLVTHGAGCNALIGALTNQPVLLDVSMASLTMATRRDDSSHPSTPNSNHNNHDENNSHSTSTSPTTHHAYRHATDHPLSASYTVQLTASTDHLRAASAGQPLSIPLLSGAPGHGSNGHKPAHHASQSQPLNTLPFVPGPFVSGPRVTGRRQRIDSLPGRAIKAAGDDALYTPPDSPSYAATFGVQRSATVGAGRSGSGLWSRSDSGAGAGEGFKERTWSVASKGEGLTKAGTVAAAGGGPTSAPTSAPTSVPTSTPTSNPNPAVQGSIPAPQNKAASRENDPKLKTGSDLVMSPTTLEHDTTRTSVDSERDVVSPLAGRGLWSGGAGGGGGNGGLWGGGGTGGKGVTGGGTASMVSNLGLKPGMSSMAMALSGRIGSPPTEDNDEITERELGVKRRWTVNERGEHVRDM